MTDLDQFAKAAMQGMLAHDDGEGGTNAELAEESFDIAEAMLAESRKRQKLDPNGHPDGVGCGCDNCLKRGGDSGCGCPTCSAIRQAKSVLGR